MLVLMEHSVARDSIRLVADFVIKEALFPSLLNFTCSIYLLLLLSSKANPESIIMKGKALLRKRFLFYLMDHAIFLR